ncbi:hypothetical protein J4221_00435 [Candidatus Pacearchaeota archaeon]|nr:hypothetical protein [Candidatus Pacearchaeota archaeon]
MVKEFHTKGQTYFQCEACGHFYLDKLIAQRCEDFCKATKGCNINLLKDSIGIKKL